MRIRNGLALCILSLACASVQAEAAPGCTESRFVPAHIECNGDRKSRSADFVQGCGVVPDHYEDVEVQCPPRWINVLKTSKMKDHASFCTSKGMKTAFIDGANCASGRHVPQTGIGHEGFKFPYGTDSGALNTWLGGTAIPDNGVLPRDGTYFFCWEFEDGKQYRDKDIVVAYSCEGLPLEE
ncbi:hypothetical protein OIU34_25015 [Pararhizobium sp. BT-229]|uniref:hypothetical protein n=1 Tax=Pararhizobium sp. BT-229 TaxID=2986923 RepID=UPI0021F7238E|nr:hypothetical protein [Pararhizobium sp. BT-229]MCV9965142.1 hypothetical protein [Pararhizobium sp. BT-229]